MNDLTEQLKEARVAATLAHIALRHANEDAADYLTWFGSQVDYTALGTTHRWSLIVCSMK